MPETAAPQETGQPSVDPNANTSAQPANDPCLSDAKCSELYESARRLSRVGQYDAALINYQQAFSYIQAPWLLINIGRIQQKLGRAQRAIQTYKRFLDLPEATRDPDLTAKAKTYLQEAERDLEAQQRARAALAKSATTPPGPSGTTPAVPGPGGTTTATPPSPDPGAGALTAGTVAKTPAAADKPSGGKSLVKKWWFWTAIGAVVAGGVIAGAVVASQPSSPGELPVFQPFPTR